MKFYQKKRIIQNLSLQNEVAGNIFSIERRQNEENKEKETEKMPGKITANFLIMSKCKAHSRPFRRCFFIVCSKWTENRTTTEDFCFFFVCEWIIFSVCWFLLTNIFAYEMRFH